MPASAEIALAVVRMVVLGPEIEIETNAISRFDRGIAKTVICDCKPLNIGDARLRQSWRVRDIAEPLARGTFKGMQDRPSERAYD